MNYVNCSIILIIYLIVDAFNKIVQISVRFVKNKDNQNTHQILSKIDKANNDNISNKSNKNTNTIKNINYVRNQLKKDELKTNLLETLITELCPWIPCFKKLSNKHKTDAKKKYLIASAYLSYDLDIITYLRNIQILEKLRDYTLSEDKKSLMNLDSRRLINSDFNLEEIEEKLEKDIEKFDDLNDSFVENIAIALSKTSDNPLLKLNDNQNKRLIIILNNFYFKYISNFYNN